MAIKVKNIKGTGTNARSIPTSWIEYWETQSNRKELRCCAYDEDESKDKDTVYRCKNEGNLNGGHVKKTGINDNKWYILPICNSHNKLNKEFYAREKDLIKATEE